MTRTEQLEDFHRLMMRQKSAERPKAMAAALERLQDSRDRLSVRIVPRPDDPMKTYNLLSLFAGIGGGAIGFLAARHADGSRFRSCGAVDYEPAAARDFERLTGSRCHVGDLSTMQPADLAAVCDAPAQRMAVHYEATLGDTTRRACEIFVFRNGMKVEAEALYGDTHPLPADASHPVIV